MPKIVNERINCPRCGSETYAWEHPSSHRHLQRYRCKNRKCRRQFVPGIKAGLSRLSAQRNTLEATSISPLLLLLASRTSRP